MGALKMLSRNSPRITTTNMAERESEPYRLDITNAASDVGLQATWGLGNQLFLFPGKKGRHDRDNRRSAADGVQPQISEVKWDMDMHKPITRKLLNESHNIFVTLQNQMTEVGGGGLKQMLVKASKQYRSVLKACCLDLYKAVGNASDEEKSLLDDQSKVFNMTELIWGLCEILWIDVAPSGVVVSQLLEWLRWHFTIGETLTAEILEEEVPEQHPEYWDCVYRLVLQGQIGKVRTLLANNSAGETEEFRSMDEVLRRMPLYSQLNKVNSLSEFDMKWRHWRDDCERRLAEKHFSYNNLNVIAQILCGQDEVFTNLKDLCETWYHMLVSKMLYQRPTVASVDLHFYVQACIDEYRSDGRLSEMDRILLSALEFDIHQVIKDCSAVLSSWWFVAHLTDLLHHCGQLESHRLEFGSNLREYLLLEFATTLMSQKSLWQVGVDYLDQCPEFGRPYLEHFIEHLPLETERKVYKVLAVCEKRNMTEQVKSICKVMGMRCIHNKQLGSALTWFLRSKDTMFTTVIAEKYLSEYNENGAFTNLDLLDHLGSNMLISNRLIFLGKYREYHKLYEGRDFHAAGSLLLSLLSSRLAPRDFWITLLKDAITLLEAREMIFSSKETYELMHCLEELTKDRLHLSSDMHTVDLSDLKETIDFLNLALTRNLARAIVTEGTVLTT